MDRENENADARIRRAFLEMLPEQPYYKMRITALCQKAGVHRSTFYRLYEDTFAVYKAVCFSFMRELLHDPAKPDIRSAEDMRVYLLGIFTRIVEKTETVRLLSGDHGNVGFPYFLGEMIRNRMQALAHKCRVTEPIFREFISFLPEYTAMYLFIRLFPEDVYVIDEKWLSFQYDISDSIAENAKRFFAEFLTGSPEIQDMLFAAYIILQSKGDRNKCSVTELLQTAGISRTEFYVYYKNIADFRDKFYRTVFSLAASFLFRQCAGEPLSETQTANFFSTDFLNFILKSARQLFEEASLTPYVACVIGNLNLRMTRLVRQRLGREELTRGEELTLRYVISKICFSCAYYVLGMTDYETYRRKIDETAPFRERLGLV